MTGSRGSGMKRLAAHHAAQNGISFDDAYNQLSASNQHPDAGYETDEGDGDQNVGQDTKLDLGMVLAWDGNLAELIAEDALKEIGAQVIREYEIDAADRKDWLETAKKALEAASQKSPGEKNTPMDKASNVKYPLLTTAIIQFAARAYPAIVRGDEVIEVKPLGDDQNGQKAKRAGRVSAFANDQLIYQCPEWEVGTDALLHALPAVGSAFRKVYWDVNLKRPKLEFVSALDVVMPMGVTSAELAPRITHEIDKFPYEIEVLTRGDNPQWLECEYQKDSSDSQKKERFLEQCRYIDLDEDGLSEPYVVTVHYHSQKVVRIDPAFEFDDVKTEQTQSGARIVKIERILPWVDYLFIPHPQGSAYGIGFGQLLGSLTDVIDTTINQMIDAGRWANTNTGFLSSAVKIRGGELALTNNTFKTLPGAMNVKDSVYRMEFPGPNQTMFNLLEFLIATAKDITSVKDVLTGDAPGSQPATSTLALIEQGLQVFSAIYKRIYRSMTREFELLFKLNARYLDDQTYQDFLDQQPPEPEVNQDQTAGIGHNGGPPMGPMDMGAPQPMPGQAPQGMPDQSGQVVPFPTGANSQLGQQAQTIQDTMQPGEQGMPQMGLPAQMQAPQGQMGGPPPGLPGALASQLQAQGQRASAAQDFNPEDMDIRPVADPTAVTEMQRLAKAQFLLQFKGDPTVNAVEINKRAFEAARLPDLDKLIIEHNPLMELQAQAQAAEAQAKAEAAKWEAAFEQARASKQAGLMQAQTDLFEAQAKEAGMPQGPPQAQPHEIALAAAQAHKTHAEATAIEADHHHKVVLEDRKQALAEHAAAMDQVDRGANLELQHAQHVHTTHVDTAKLNIEHRKTNHDEARVAIEKKSANADAENNKKLTDLKAMVAEFDKQKSELEMLKREAEHQQAQAKLKQTQDEAKHQERIAKLKEDAEKAKTDAEKAKADAALEAALVEKTTHEVAKKEAARNEQADSATQARMAELTQAMAQLMKLMQATAAQMNQPKRVIRDGQGKIIGVEPVKGKTIEARP